MGGGPWDRQVYPMQLSTSGSNALPASPPSSESESEHVDKTSVHQYRESNQTAKETKPWHRRGYPLQAPASQANLRQSPTPPPSPKGEPEHGSKPAENQSGQNQQTTTKSKALRRQGYPLQSPASVANLRDSSQNEEESSVDQSGQHELATIKKKALRRQGYPLQSPASVVDLRGSPQNQEKFSVNQSGQNEDESSTNQSGQYELATPKPLRRQVYPLQSPAIAGNLQRSPSPPPSPPSSVERVPQNEDESSAKKSQESEVATTKASHRQVYPLQPSASVVNLQRSPSLSPSVERVVQNGDESSAKQSREKELATTVINHWRRQLYPVQSPKNGSPYQRSPTPQPPEEEADKDKSHSIHLPKNIRAVTDAEKRDPAGRTIVVCLDGTGDKFDNDNSNIVHLVSSLKKDDPHQVSYYQAGIGTYGDGGLSGGVSAALDMAVGSGLGLHVRDAYHFLMHSYKEGDKICIFGFSRGAYTARCLAGMIHKVGLLPPRNLQQIPFAYEFYANDTPEGWKQSEDFKRTFCIDVNVYFLGCFDSVASVGFIPRQLPLSSTPTSKPRYFRHAMALDERRAKFKICRHQTKDWDEIKKPASSTDAIAKSAKSSPLHFLPGRKSQDDAPPRDPRHAKYGKSNHPNLTDEEYERLTGHEAPFNTNVLEVWFAGAHADIGGGAVPNDERHKLAQIPLRWMIRQAFECNTGIIFKTRVLTEYGLDVHTLWPKYERLSAPAHGPPPSVLEKYEQCLPPRSVRGAKLVPIDKHQGGEHFYHLKSRTDEDWTPEQVEDFYDAMSPLNDQLIQAPSWWILELLPVEYKVPITPGVVTTRVGMNWGQYRGVEDYEPNLHWTALRRAQHMGYKVRVRTAPHTTWRTVV